MDSRKLNRRQAVSLLGGAAAIGAIVREEIAAGHLPGAVVVVGVDDKVVLRQA